MPLRDLPGVSRQYADLGALVAADLGASPKRTLQSAPYGGDAPQRLLNLLARPTDSPELVVDQVVSIFHGLYRDSWGPRTDDILRAAIVDRISA